MGEVTRAPLARRNVMWSSMELSDIVPCKGIPRRGAPTRTSEKRKRSHTLVKKSIIA